MSVDLQGRPNPFEESIDLGFEAYVVTEGGYIEDQTAAQINIGDQVVIFIERLGQKPKHFSGELLSHVLEADRTVAQFHIMTDEGEIVVFKKDVKKLLKL